MQIKFRKARGRNDTTGWTAQLDSEQITHPSAVHLHLNQKKKPNRKMQLHFSCDTFLQSYVLFEKSNYFEGCCFCWQQFLKSLRSLKMLPVVKRGWSTSLWVMALMWFPSCQPLSISLMSRSQSLWYLCKAGKLNARFRNGVAHRQRDRWLLRLHGQAVEELS